MNANHDEAPASYDDIGVGDANPEVQKCVNRIYKASGKYPWDWLPRDYVPKVAAWGTNAALNLALAVEAVHAHGSTVTMDELREFLVQRARERQKLSKNGKPVKPTMNSDCAKARKWIEDNMVNSQSTSKQNKHKRTIGPSDRHQHSPPAPPDPTWAHKRDMPPPPSPVPSKRSRHVEQFVSNNIDDSKVASSLVDAEEEACLSQAETMMLYAINRSLRTSCERIEAAENLSNGYNQEIENTRNNLAATYMEVRHVLQTATRDRDEKQKKVRQLKEEKHKLAAMIEDQGGKCSETLQDMYDGFILEYEKAQKELENVQNTLEAMEEESQKNKQHQDGQDKITSLEKGIAEQKEIIKRETRRKSAPDEKLYAEHEAAMKSQEYLS
ncbi:hypothetical protein FPRO04_08400 [Fusarium proliferatum]|nr:hypothetical protein FPRO03_04278 [Fusarium proliferatum]KAG4275487.1 hypothetical protein FPRO04_08400 [Fusarium proliferatum]